MDIKEIEKLAIVVETILPENHGFILIAGSVLDGQFNSKVLSNLNPELLTDVLKSCIAGSSKQTATKNEVKAKMRVLKNERMDG